MLLLTTAGAASADAGDAADAATEGAEVSAAVGDVEVPVAAGNAEREAAVAEEAEAGSESVLCGAAVAVGEGLLIATTNTLS